MHEDEVKAKPYVSPSLQVVLKKHAAEAVRVQQLLLADDFRERALMKMMDGVLEIRWEDTIKTDVREPACMLEKQPEQYTSADVAAVKQYRADVEALRQERERYKRMLEADYAKITAQLQDSVNKFDCELNELFQVTIPLKRFPGKRTLETIRFGSFVELGVLSNQKGHYDRAFQRPMKIARKIRAQTMRSKL